MEMRVLLAVRADENIIDDPLRCRMAEHRRLGIAETLTRRYLRH
jgi:hypothetical protein